MKLGSLESKMLESYDSIEKETNAFVASIQAKGMADRGIDDVRDKICSIWSKIKPFIAILEKLPIVGKYVSLLAKLLDAICPA